jgi:hypothetical protein
MASRKVLGNCGEARAERRGGCPIALSSKPNENHFCRSRRQRARGGSRIGGRPSVAQLRRPGRRSTRPGQRTSISSVYCAHEGGFVLGYAERSGTATSSAVAGQRLSQRLGRGRRHVGGGRGGGRGRTRGSARRSPRPASSRCSMTT